MRARVLFLAGAVVVLGAGVMQLAALKNQGLPAVLLERMQRDPRLRSQVLAEVAATKGKPSIVVVEPSLFRVFPPLLTWTQSQQFAGALEEPAPVRVDGDLYFGSGCRAHACGANEAAWLIDGQTGAAIAVLMDEAYDPGVLPRMKQFELFGQPNEPLPGPIEGWARVRGMTGQVRLDRYGFARVRFRL